MTFAVVIEIFLCGLLPFGTICLLVSVLPIGLSPCVLHHVKDLPAFSAAVLVSVVYLFGAISFPILHWLTRACIENNWLCKKLWINRCISAAYGDNGLNHDEQFINVLNVLEEGKLETFRMIDHGGALSIVLKSVVVSFPPFAIAYALRLLVNEQACSQLITWTAISITIWVIGVFAHCVYGKRQAGQFRLASEFLQGKRDRRG